MTSPNTNSTSVQEKAQELVEMYRYGQLTIEETVAAAVTVGLDVAQEIYTTCREGSDIYGEII